MKLYIIGYARSGKDYAGEFLKKSIGLKFESSSYFAAKHFIYNDIKEIFGYKNIEECFADRHNNRDLWYNMITDFNKPDRTALSEFIFKENDAYIGLRNFKELEAAKNRWVDCVTIWIDAENRIPPESSESCTVRKDQADFIIENKTDLNTFDTKLEKLSMFLKPYLNEMNRGNR